MAETPSSVGTYKPGLMGIWAHPDDESSMAGTMARAVAQGHPVAVVCATRGEKGQIAPGVDATPETLGRVRERELRAACAAVGVHDVSFLDYVDGQLQDADPDEAAGRIVYHLRRFRPDVVVTFAANGGYGHVDHKAIHRFTLASVAAAADPAQYPEQARDGLEPHRVRKVYFGAGFPRERLVEMVKAARARGMDDFIPGGDEATLPIEEMGTPMADLTTFVALDDAAYEARLREFAAHASQMAPNSPWAKASPEEMRQWMNTEIYQLAPPPISDRAYPTPEVDVFAGL